ncbi:EXS family-domain-containing protein, partial [Pilobolus umbonatus]
RILLSYCFPVEFRDFFIADELNSLAYSLWTSAYFFCAYSFKWTDLDDSCNIAVMWIAPFLASLPPWWRLLQCFRRYRDSSESVHLYNGAKYLSSIMAAIVTGLRRMRPSLFMDTFWIVTCVINSCYTTTWDIKMDWGLLNVNSRYFLLRNEIVFYPWTYYVAVPINVLLRFSWVLNLCHLNIHTQVLAIIIALMEGYRRIQWNFFRLENEHLNNCGQYRAIKDIPLPFALPDMDTKSAQLNDEEEATSILSHHRLPSTTLENVIPPMMIPISRHTSQNNGRQSVGGPDSMYGSFYGRRDFENKQDPDPDMVVGSFSASHRLSRRPSTMENVLTKIKSMRNSIQSDDSDNEEEDENSEEN